MTNHSPGDIIRYYMIQAGMCDFPGTNHEWKCYVNFMPDEEDNAISFNDTAAVPDGRSMRGETYLHPGLQILIRATDQAKGWQRSNHLFQICETVKRQVIKVTEDVSYFVDAVRHRTGIVSLGFEEHYKTLERQIKEVRRGRFVFVLNMYITMRRTTEVTPFAGVLAELDLQPYWLTQVPSGVINGINQVFTITALASGTVTYMLFVNNTIQSRSDYTLRGTTITFRSGKQPLSGSTLLLVVIDPTT